MSRIVIALFYQQIDVDYPCKLGENREYPQRWHSVDTTRYVATFGCWMIGSEVQAILMLQPSTKPAIFVGLPYKYVNIQSM